MWFIAWFIALFYRDLFIVMKFGKNLQWAFTDSDGGSDRMIQLNYVCEAL